MRIFRHALIIAEVFTVVFVSLYWSCRCVASTTVRHLASLATSAVQVLYEIHLTCSFIPAPPGIEPLAKEWLGRPAFGLGSENPGFRRPWLLRCHAWAGFSNKSAVVHQELFLGLTCKRFAERPSVHSSSSNAMVTNGDKLASWRWNENRIRALAFLFSDPYL